MKRTLSAVIALTAAAGALTAPAMASAQQYGGGYGYQGGGYQGGGYQGSGYDQGYEQSGYGDDGYRSPCQVKKRQGTATGAVVGGLLGAVVGSNVSGHGARTEGSAVGAVAGALLGSQIGRSSAKSSDTCLQQGFYDRHDQYRTYGQNYYYNDGFYDQRGQWRTYDRNHDRRYYQGRYGQGQGYNTYNYGRGW